MKFTTPDGELTWNGRGDITGDPRLRQAVIVQIASGVPTAWHYWGEIVPSIATPWKAYLTIGGALCDQLGYEDPDIEVDEFPDPPGGYEPEGPQ